MCGGEGKAAKETSRKFSNYIRSLPVAIINCFALLRKMSTEETTH
jgi:hypothetical protein